MKIIFTICSNNYLAQAKALGDSLKKTNPDYHFFIGLVDILSPEINYDMIGYNIIPANEIDIPYFESLWKKYKIVELNTCVKPFYLEYFTKKYVNLEYLMYFDPDTFIYGKISEIENELINNKEILLTPHILSPIPLDGKNPGENTFLNYGIYNLGFIAIKNPKNNTSFFRWWSERTYKVGFDIVSQGFFVDQLWINLIPIYYSNVCVSKNPGLNMAPWNLHERILAKNDIDNWIVNENQNLIFYHFSNYKYTSPEILASYYDRYGFEDRKDLVVFYKEYLDHLLNNNIEQVSKIECKYIQMRNSFLQQQNLTVNINSKNNSLTGKIKNNLKRFFR